MPLKLVARVESQKLLRSPRWKAVCETDAVGKNHTVIECLLELSNNVGKSTEL